MADHADPEHCDVSDDATSAVVDQDAGDQDEGGLPSDHILDLLPMPDGRLFVATSAGLVILRDGVFEAAPPFHHPRPGMVLRLFAAPDASVWVGTQSGVERLAEGRFVPVFEDEAAQALVASGVLTLAQAAPVLPYLLLARSAARSGG